MDLSPSKAVVHVVDDDASMRQALARLLALAGYEVRLYACAADYLLSAPDDRPGCLLLDLSMPGASGLALQESLKWHPAYAKPVIFLTGCGDVPSSVRAIKAGACDFLVKPAHHDQLLAAVAQALGRAAHKRAGEAQRAESRRHFELLSAREHLVLAGVLEGKLNKQIAFDLGVNERTVKSDRARIFDHLGVSSLPELVQLASAFEARPPGEPVNTDALASGRP